MWHTRLRNVFNVAARLNVPQLFVSACCALSRRLRPSQYYKTMLVNKKALEVEPSNIDPAGSTATRCTAFRRFTHHTRPSPEANAAIPLLFLASPHLHIASTCIGTERGVHWMARGNKDGQSELHKRLNIR